MNTNTIKVSLNIIFATEDPEFILEEDKNICFRHNKLSYLFNSYQSHGLDSGQSYLETYFNIYLPVYVFFMQYEWTYNMYLERPKEYIERQIKKNSMAIREAAKNITAFFLVVRPT